MDEANFEYTSSHLSFHECGSSNTIFTVPAFTRQKIAKIKMQQTSIAFGMKPTFKNSNFPYHLTAIFQNRYGPSDWNGKLQFIKRNAMQWPSSRCASGNCFQARRKQKLSMNYVGELPYITWTSLLHFNLSYRIYRNRNYTVRM